MSTHDYVIVGAGSAGCVLANRLSADPGVRVLLIEAGGSDRKLNIRIPVGFAKQFRTDLDWGYTAEPEPSLIGRSMYLPRGRSLGGSSSMNAMIYMRGNRGDFDGWAENGAPGWSYRDVLPYFKRSEHNERIRDEYHGQGGELNVADPVWTSTLAPLFVESAAGVGIRRTEDFNGAVQDGAGMMQLTQKRGRRWSAADAFLHPVAGRQNLEVRTGARARRVLLESGRAVGVEYEVDGARATARAEREVIASAGAYNSPQLLMLSGIGPADHLREVGIEPVVDNPHVGAHLMDHPLATITYECRDPVSLFDATNPKYLVQYVVSRGKGKLSSNVAEAGAHTRVGAGAPWPDFQILFGAAYYFDNGFRAYPGHAFTCGPSFVRPASEGEVRLRSADPRDPPAVRLGWFQDPAEMRAMIDAVRLSREIAETGPLGSAAIRNLDPGPGVRTDEQVEAWLRAELQHTYHAACTCRMGDEDGGALDPELRVRGVEGLRVSDASSMPRVTSGNTNAPTIMIAERGADLILGRGPLQPDALAAEPEAVTAAG
ncbi:MAG: GMC family oxidoreductase N-terminal domain-containing protein [Actinobacteria bacterium]|nr:GMC family oxidoreductase N-terminal domain-containing protein [Actinomycetota bacterium]